MMIRARPFMREMPTDISYGSFPYAQPFASKPFHAYLGQIQPAEASVEYNGICGDHILLLIECTVDIFQDLDVQSESILLSCVGEERL